MHWDKLLRGVRDRAQGPVYGSGRSGATPGAGRLGEKVALGKDPSRLLDVAEGKPRTIGDIQKAVSTVGEIEDPQPGHQLRADALGADRRVEAPLPSCGSPLGLRFGTRRRSRARRGPAGRGSGSRPDTPDARDRDRLRDVWYSGYSPWGVRVRTQPARSNPGSSTAARRSRRARSQRSRCGRPECRSTCAAARSIRASPRRLRLYVGGPGSPTHVTTRPCSMRPTRCSLSASHVIDPIVPGDEQEAVRVAEREPCQVLGETRRQRDARQVVVREGRVAAVTGDEDLFLGLAGQVALPVREAPRLERGVDPHHVLAVLERLELLVCHTEAPRLGVVGRAVGDQVWLVGERVDVLLQLGQGHPCVHRNAVADDVEVAVRKIDDAATGRDPRCTRRGCSIPSGRSSRRPPCRSGPRGAPRGSARRSGAGSRGSRPR